MGMADLYLAAAEADMIRLRDELRAAGVHEEHLFSLTKVSGVTTEKLDRCGVPEDKQDYFQRELHANDAMYDEWRLVKGKEIENGNG